MLLAQPIILDGTVHAVQIDKGLFRHSESLHQLCKPSDRSAHTNCRKLLEQGQEQVQEDEGSSLDSASLLFG